jgi:hypothetical protein
VRGRLLPDPAAFAAAAGRAAWRRPASIISAHLAGKIISEVTVSAPGRYAAVAVARAVVADALQPPAMPSGPSAGDRAHRRAEADRTACATLPLPAAPALCACGQQVSAESSLYRWLNLSCLLPAHTVDALAVNRTLGMPVSDGLLKPASGARLPAAYRATRGRPVPAPRPTTPRRGRGRQCRRVPVAGLPPCYQPACQPRGVTAARGSLGALRPPRVSSAGSGLAGDDVALRTTRG